MKRERVTIILHWNKLSSLGVRGKWRDAQDGFDFMAQERIVFCLNKIWDIDEIEKLYFYIQILCKEAYTLTWYKEVML